MAQKQQTSTITFAPPSGSFTYASPSPATDAVGTFSVINASGTFQKFDPSLGKLSSVTFFISFDFAATNLLDKTIKTDGATGTLTQTVSTTLAVPGQTPNSVMASQNIFTTYSIGAGNGPGGPGTGKTQTITFSSSISGSQAYSDPSFLNSLRGTGTQSYTAAVATVATVTNNPGSTAYLANSQTQISNLTGTVVYNFDPTPAPPGVVSGLIGIAMGGAQFGFVRFRRRRARKQADV
jgi:hypothetical protein